MNTYARVWFEYFIVMTHLDSSNVRQREHLRATLREQQVVDAHQAK